MKALAAEKTQDRQAAKALASAHVLADCLPSSHFDNSGHSAPAIFRKASCSCGGGCPACQTNSGSLKISQPNDPAEIEADQIADRVMRMSIDDAKPKTAAANKTNKIHRKCDACENDEEEVAEKPVMRKEAFASATSPPSDTPPSIKNVLNSGGHPLDLETRIFFEPRFGADLGHVRTFSDSYAGQSARSINARAYTLGSNIVFDRGEYNPKSESGKQLLAHELAHVAQPAESSTINRSMIYRQAREISRDSGCGKDFLHEFTGVVNDEDPKKHRGVPKKFHVMTRGETSGTVVRKVTEADLVARTEIDAGQLDKANPLWRAVCHEIPNMPRQIFWVLNEYVTTKEAAAAAVAKSVPTKPASTTGPVPATSTQQPAGGGLSVLTDLELETEINLMRIWLDEHPEDGTQKNQVLENLGIYEDEAGRRIEADTQAADEVLASNTSETDELSTGQSVDTTTADEVFAEISRTPVASMSGTELENEINDLLFALDLPALDLQNPIAVTQDFAPTDNEWDLFYRLNELEIEYFERRGLSDQVREATNILATQQRESGLTVGKALQIGTGLVNPLTTPMALFDAGGAVLGNPVEDFATGFLPGFLAGAVIELPRDAYQKLDAETKEHWIAFNGGIMVGIPVGALEGVWELFVGLYELGKLAVEFSPIGMAWSGGKDVYRMITDYERYDEEETKKLKERQAIAEAVIDLIIDMFKDPAFMLEHGRELGEIAGRSAGRWFNEDFMKRSTFDKGYTIGKVEGRVVFEILALFLGPEEWIARGAVAAGQFAKLSGPLRKAIIALIEKVPALKKMMEASKLAKGERLLGEAMELTSGAGKLVDEVAGGTRITDEAAELAAGTRKLATETGDASKILDPEDIADLGPINRDTVISFQKHPDMLRVWAEHPQAAQALKFCESPCWPENLKPEQIERLDEFVRRAKAQGVTFDRRKLNNALKSSDETQVNNLLDGLEGRLDPTPPETGLGTTPDADMTVVDRPPPGSHSEAGLSGQVGEATEAANAGARKLPQTYAQRFSPQTREELRQIFSDFGDDALTEFVNRLDLPQGGLAQVEIPTSEGLRKVDRLFRDGANIVMREVKNYTKSVLDRTARIADEIAKDIAILGRFPEARVEWVVNGTIRQGLLDELVLLEAEWPGRFRLIHGEPFNIIP